MRMVGSWGRSCGSVVAAIVATDKLVAAREEDTSAVIAGRCFHSGVDVGVVDGVCSSVGMGD